MLCAGLAVRKHSSCPEYTSYSPAGRKHSQAVYSLTPRVYVIGITIVTIIVLIVIIMIIIVVIVINSNRSRSSRLGVLGLRAARDFEDCDGNGSRYHVSHHLDSSKWVM